MVVIERRVLEKKGKEYPVWLEKRHHEDVGVAAGRMPISPYTEYNVTHRGRFWEIIEHGHHDMVLHADPETGEPLYGTMYFHSEKEEFHNEAREKIKEMLGEEAEKYITTGKIGWGRYGVKFDVASYLKERGMRVDDEVAKKLFDVYYELLKIYHKHHG